MNNDLFEKVTIPVTLILQSDLHIGDSASSAQGKEQGEESDENSNIAYICRGYEDKPYIPASSIRGLLRERFQQWDSEVSNSLFGEAKIAEDEITKGKVDEPIKTSSAAKLWLTDAMVDSEIKSATRFRNAIDPVLNVTVLHQLFVQEFVPAGATFKFEIQLKKVTQSEIDQVIGLLNAFNEKEPHALGGSKNMGFGLFYLVCDEIKAITTEALIAWLMGGSSAQITSTALSPGQLDLELPHPPAIQVILKPQSPLLIHDVSQVLSKNEKKESDPDLYFMYRKIEAKNELFISGTTLKGMIRARARKILLTLLINGVELTQASYEEDKKRADSLCNELFGSTDQASKLRFSDGIASNTAVHQQTFNAIDRFSGGVADGALYTVQAATAEKVEFTISIVKPLEDWQKGLLLFIARDAMEGDLAVGWGKNKGFGAFYAQLSLEDNLIDSLPKLYETFDKTEVEDWLNCLTSQLELKNQEKADV